MKFDAWFLIVLLAGCPETHATLDGGGGTDSPRVDAPAALVDAGLDAGEADAAMPPLDGGGYTDIVASGTLPEQAGRTLVLRVWDNVVPMASVWRRIPVDASGRVEVRLVGAMPPDVFGVFVQYYFDEGDGVCDGDPAFEAFVSNGFGSDVTLPIDANPDTATTCANATREP